MLSDRKIKCTLTDEKCQPVRKWGCLVRRLLLLISIYLNRFTFVWFKLISGNTQRYWARNRFFERNLGF